MKLLIRIDESSSYYKDKDINRELGDSLEGGRLDKAS